MRRALISFFIFQAISAYAEPLVLVSVPPIQYYVSYLVDDAAQVASMVPAGADPHTYAPTPRQVTESATAVLWFRIGESFEPGVAAALAHAAPDLKQVNLLEGLPLIQGAGCPHCGPGAADPHVWMSARLSQQMATHMAASLKERLPQLAPRIDARLAELIEDLQGLDRDLATLLKPFRGDALLVSHPAFAYFCRDYNLRQIAVEQAGKEATPRQITYLLSQLEHEPVRVVILQANAPNTGAQLIANHLDLPTCVVNPLAEDIPRLLRHLGECIAQ